MRIFSLSVLLTSLVSVVNAAPAAKQAESAASLNLMDLFHQGGWVMYPLLGLSVIMVYLIILYTFTIRQNAVVSDRFMDDAEIMIRNRDLQGLAQYSRKKSECIARITQRVTDFILNNPSTSLAEVREITESEGSRQASILASRVSYLSDIGNIAPMIGLLATVIGIIQAFTEMSHKGELGNQTLLSSGISVALIGTASGLLVAIPSLLAYSFFRTRTQRYIGELEAASSHLVALLQTLTVKPVAAPPMSQRSVEGIPPMMP